MTSDFQALRQARVPVVELEPATEGSLQMSGWTRWALGHRRPLAIARQWKDQLDMEVICSPCRPYIVDHLTKVTLVRIESTGLYFCLACALKRLPSLGTKTFYS
ncbi:hypothetical protein PoB_000646700 [Plakobranchus ocellatus]|uniref:Uncharacterized protein n=1 Tax=Plakobranchus ocellatus TaxID=259542 RepID=A0AAV3YC13_9GAST|nr:hypothetical protein PoB_000646700 [Plakobranchus ocellatus]